MNHKFTWRLSQQVRYSFTSTHYFDDCPMACAKASRKIRFSTLLLLSIFLLGIQGAWGASRTASVSGNWSNTATWGGSAVPTSGDDITINAGITVTMDANGSCSVITSMGNGSSIAGSFTLTLTAAATITVPASATATISCILAGAGTSLGISVGSGGVLILSGTNTYTGPTTISTGILRITNGSALGTSASGTTVSNGARLELDGGVDGITVAAETVSIAGTGPTGNAAIDNISGNNIWGGTVTLTANAAVRNQSGTMTFNNSSSFVLSTFELIIGGATTGGTGIISGVISGAGIVRKVTNGGVWTLSGANTHSGGTTLAAGTLNINNAKAIGTGNFRIGIDGGTSTIINNTSADDITLTTNNTQSWEQNFRFIGTKNLNLGTGAVTLSTDRQVTVTAGTLTVGGTINDNLLSLTKAGAGNLNFGANPITLKNMTINAGTLVSTSGTLSLAGNFSNSGTFTHNSGTVTFNGTAAQTINSGGSSFNNLSITNTSGTCTAEINAMTIDGALTTSTGSNLDMGGNQLLGALTSITNNGTIRTANTSSTPIPTGRSWGGTVILYGTGVKTLPAGTFSSLTINSTNSTDIVNLDGAVTVSGGVLTLTNGIVKTSAANLLTLDATATASFTNVSSPSFIDGPMAKVSTAAFTFPVGKSGSGMRAISISAPSSSSTFQAEFLRSAAPNRSSIGSGLAQVSGCEYWTLSRTNGSGSTNVSLSWNSESPCNNRLYVTNLADLRVARFNGSQWVSEGNTATSGNTVSGTVTSGSIANFSNFSLGGSAVGGNPLPVKFIDVKAFEKEGKVQVDWTNLTESDLLNYTVEHSVNALDFSTIALISPRGNHYNSETYSSIHTSPVTGANFYRIRATELGGKIIFSPLMRVMIGNRSTDIMLFPNPVRGKQLSLVLTAAKGQYKLQVVNSLGQQVYTQWLNHQGGTLSQMISFPETLKPGMYSLLFSGVNYNETKAFIVDE